MGEVLNVQATTREGKYVELLPQLEALLKGETDIIANTANICAALKQTFGFFWIGFYFVRGNELVLGPFQGPIACTRISKGKGVCGYAWKTAKTVIVDDVEKFPGHIACSSLSRSEIVIPLFGKKNEVIGVLDIDSDKLSDFSATDEKYLFQMIGFLK